MLIKTLTVGQLETNCYIVTDEITKDCAIIDPGDESNTILDYIESNNLNPKSIFLTHGHFDHHMALWEVWKSTGGQIWVHERDVSHSEGRDMHKLSHDSRLQYYKEGDVIKAGSLEFTVLETPGHSPGSVTLRCEDALFTGDTLFRDSCGRTDLGGDMNTLMESLRKVSGLSGDFEVYPGHAESTTLERERMFNYYMRYALNEHDG